MSLTSSYRPLNWIHMCFCLEFKNTFLHQVKWVFFINTLYACSSVCTTLSLLNWISIKHLFLRRTWWTNNKNALTCNHTYSCVVCFVCSDVATLCVTTWCVVGVVLTWKHTDFNQSHPLLFVISSDGPQSQQNMWKYRTLTSNQPHYQ